MQLERRWNTISFPVTVLFLLYPCDGGLTKNRAMKFNKLNSRGEGAAAAMSFTPIPQIPAKTINISIHSYNS